MISQLTIFLQNKEGRLASACRALGDAGVNMRSLCIADTRDFGVVRIICDTPRKACDHLVEEGFRATLVPVIAVKVGDRPGGLASLLELLDEKGMNVEYGYCFSYQEGEDAIDVLKISDEAVELVLKDAGYQLLDPADLYVED
ncbi:MAG TPA: amino acid-binding protein [Candidatus Aveggerthella stercoripullorum]|uniref:Amino acid-binding protein n=1 Tax=Candidatus Aveggerthella stercoripullorum TaxID=2840688 RepID=A0A9D1A2R2_9ACTN|nr:amino acid-binding protein [Candidatus Aveggerthella stercoripullorum]